MHANCTPTDPRAATAARHQRGATKSVLGLLWSFIVSLRWWYLPMLLSRQGKLVLKRKYDAVTTDNAYDLQPRGSLGFVGRAIDRQVLKMPVHAALRQRLRLVVAALKGETRRAARHNPDGAVRVLSAPCGLSRDLLTAVRELKEEAPDVAKRLDLHGLDLDASDEAIPISRQRAALARVPVTYHREDLFNSRGLDDLFAKGQKFHVANCIGLTAWLDLHEVEKLGRHFHDKILAPGGSLVVDNWAPHSTSHLGNTLQINTRYHAPADFLAAFANAGFRVEREETTSNGVVTVYVLRAV